MGKILIIDDDMAFASALAGYINESYPALQVDICIKPLEALALINKGNADLLLVDLEMPTFDGTKILNYAIQAGISKNRIVILSGRDADYLHEHFPMGSCLAVLNKFEARQKDVLDMIFTSLQKKAAS